MNKSLVALVVLSMVLASYAGASVIQYGSDAVPFTNGDWTFFSAGEDNDTRLPVVSNDPVVIHNPTRAGGAIGLAGFVWNAPANEVITSVSFSYGRNFGYWIPAMFGETTTIPAETTFDTSSLTNLLAQTAWTGSVGGWLNVTYGAAQVDFLSEDGIKSISLGVVTQNVCAPGHPGLLDIGYGAAETALFDGVIITTEVVPEPATMSLLGCGVVGMLLRRKR